MKIKSLKSNALKGVTYCPSDKSISHRAIILSALTKGESYIDNLLSSEDIYATLEWAKLLGVQIKKVGDRLTIFSEITKDNLQHNKIYMFYLGNSGTSARLLMGVMAGMGGKSIFFGDKSLNKRPMLRVLQPLMLMGAQVSVTIEKNTKIHNTVSSILYSIPNYIASQLLPIMSTFQITYPGFLPAYIIGGNLNGIKYDLEIASAQIKSAILLAGLFTEDKTIIWEKYPSRNHTENMLKSCGINLKISNNPKGGNDILLEKGNKILTPQHWVVPGDFSSSAFIIVATLLVPNSEVTIRGVNLNPLRTGLLQILLKMGANIRVKNYKTKSCGEDYGDIEVKYTTNLQPVKVTPDIVPLMIDEFPILSCLVSTIDGKSEFLGIEELRYKESDRITAIESNLNKLGIVTESTQNSLIIYGNTNITKFPLQEISANLDHRIAMSFLVLGLVLEQGIIVKDATTINTSFPNFLNTMQKLKANISKYI